MNQPPELHAREGRLASCPSSPNCVSSQADDDRHRIAPLAYTGSGGTAWRRLRDVLAVRKDTTIIEEAPDCMKVEFRTLLGFVDDGEFLLDAGHGVIHVRSAARLGYSDLGKNRRRMEEIRKEFAASPP